jgi:hypothetical protein
MQQQRKTSSSFFVTVVPHMPPTVGTSANQSSVLDGYSKSGLDIEPNTSLTKGTLFSKHQQSEIQQNRH